MIMERGYISVVYTVWCASCTTWLSEPGPKCRAVRNWRSAGWKNTRHSGWVCPDCIDPTEYLKRMRAEDGDD